MEVLNDNVNVLDNDFDRYDTMLLNPLRYENMSKNPKQMMQMNLKVQISIVYALTAHNWQKMKKYILNMSLP